VAVAVKALVGDATGRHLQRREQGSGPVPHIVVAAPLGAARAQRQVGSGADSAWIWLFSSTQTTMARSGGCRYRPTTSRTLASSCGSVENLKVSSRHGLRSYSAHTRATVLWLTPSWSASSRDDQCVTPRCSGGGVSVAARISARRSARTVWGRPRAGLVEQPIQAGLGVAVPPEDDGRA
jgi:hypothetical protein